MGGVEKPEGVMQVSWDSVAEFSQCWQGASIILWSSSGHPKCRIAPGKVSERKFSLRFNCGLCSTGCSILPPSPLRYTTHTQTLSLPPPISLSLSLFLPPSHQLNL